MMARMKYRLMSLLFAAALLLAPVIAFAAEDEETGKLEGRVEGYANNMHLPAASTSLTWIMIGFLSALTVACLFKNAKRTHLD